LTVEQPSFVTCFGIDTEIRVVALVGAGGKTSLMYRLAHELNSSGRLVVTTTTTKIFTPEPYQSPKLVLLSEDPKLEYLQKHLSKYRHLTIGELILPNGKVQGVTSSVIEQCLSVADIIVLEADGAAGKSIKAPEDWEPVLPEMVDLVIPVVGLDCIDRQAGSETVFRLERFLKVTDLKPTQTITPQIIGRLLAHPAGSLKNVPDSATIVPYLNKLDMIKDETIFQDIIETAFSLSHGRIKKGVAGQLRGRLDVKLILPIQNKFM
jgi:probable selenium-dependent hydroxylase accessory protein YqeC